MNFPKKADYIVFLMRICMGWMLIYDGYMKFVDKSYSPLSYIQNAHSFSAFYDWLALSSNIGWVTFLTIWGPIFIGAALLLGFRVRFAAIMGIIMIALFYFPILDFPIITTGGYIIDRNIIYILVLALLFFARAGDMWGLDAKVEVTIKT